MTRKLVFVDIDGVLNSTAWARRRSLGQASNLEVTIDGRTRSHQIDVDAVALLDLLVRPGVEFVLSSTWRGDGGPERREYVERLLRSAGWRGRFIGSTPVLVDGSPALRRHAPSIRVDWSRSAQPTRGEEIFAWLAGEDLIEGWGTDVRIAVLDDDPDVAPLGDHFVHVDDEHGLRRCDVLRAWDLLGEVVVMVDDLVPRPTAKHACFRPGSCHLTVNGTSEAHLHALHEAARSCGLKRAWFQDHQLAAHYDLVASKQTQALDHGAVFIPARDQARERQRIRGSGDGWRTVDELAAFLSTTVATVESAIRLTGMDRASDVHVRGDGGARAYSPGVQAIVAREVRGRRGGDAS